MGENLDQILRHRWGEDWLIGADSDEFWQKLDQHCQTLEKYGQQESLWLVVEENPARFLGKILAASSLGYSVILGNPQWGKSEWDQVASLRPIIWSDCPIPLADPLADPLAEHSSPRSGLRDASLIPPGIAPAAISLDGDREWFEALGPKFLIPTGGSSGQTKLVVHTWHTLMASVQGFRAHFDVNQVNAHCVLPLFHVSGLMQALRVLVSGGRLVLQPYKDLKQGHRLSLPKPGFLSLVPTQLQWLLGQGDTFVPWLQRFRAVLLGGAPAWPGLLQQARELAIPLALTYGMTETASQVATLLPEQFLAGVTSSGRTLPHGQIRVVNSQNHELEPGQSGRLAIGGQSLAWGYLWPRYPPKFSPLGITASSLETVPKSADSQAVSCHNRRWKDATHRQLLTDDMGFWDREGYLHIVGRCSNKLITGGENIFPESVEAALLSFESIQDVCVVGLPDQRWGQRLCAVVEFSTSMQPLAALPAMARSQLAPYQCPKDWIVVDALPRTSQGKVNRQHILKLAQSVLGVYADHPLS